MRAAPLIPVGMNARLFPSNWRPFADEVAFASRAGFDLLQVPGPEAGLGHERLGQEPAEAGAALREAGLGAVMEIVLRVGADARTASGRSAADVVAANLPAAAALGVERAHLHAVGLEPLEGAAVRRLEERLLGEIADAVAVAAAAGVRLGLEHNEPRLRLFASPQRCREALAAVDGLGFVWDLSHTPPDELAHYLDLSSRMMLIHVSDTPLPLLNGHLPLGEGTLDVTRYLRGALAGGFGGPAVLEIGGHPRSGGFGRDADEALERSGRRLRKALGR